MKNLFQVLDDKKINELCDVLRNKQSADIPTLIEDFKRRIKENTIKQGLKYPYSEEVKSKEEALDKALLHILYDCASSLKHGNLNFDDNINALSNIFDCVDYILRADYLAKDGKQKFLALNIKGNIFYRKAEFFERSFESGDKWYKKALECFFNAYDGNDNCSVYSLLSMYNLGSCYRKMGEYDLNKLADAIQNYIQVVDCIGDSDDKLLSSLRMATNNKLGACYLVQSYYNLAVNFFNKTISELIKIDYSGEVCQTERKVLEHIIDYKYDRLGNKGKSGHAKGETNPYLLEALVQIGIMRRKQGFIQEALNIFDTILQYFDRDNRDAINNKGVCYRKQGRYHEALSEFQKKPEDHFAEMNILKCKIELGRYEEAQKRLKKIVEQSRDRNEKNPWALFNLGLCYREQYLFYPAYKCFKAVCDISPELKRKSYQLKAYYNIGICFMGLYKFARAIKVFDKIIAVDQGDWPSWMNKGWCLQSLGYYEEALECYDIAKEINDKLNLKENMAPRMSMSIRNNRGICYRYKGDYDKAEACFKEVLADEPTNYYTLYNQALCFYKQEKYHEAKEGFRSSLEQERYNHNTNSYYLICLLKYIDKLNKNPEPNCELIKKLDCELERYLENSVKNYSLIACRELFNYYELLQDKISQSEMEKKHRRFSQISLIEGEEGYRAFASLFKNKVYLGIGTGDEKKALMGRINGELFSIYSAVCRIKNACRVHTDKFGGDEKDDRYVHYTKLNVLNILLGDPQNGKLRLWNTAYMNDVTEGDIFYSILNKVNVDKDQEEHYKIIAKYNPAEKKKSSKYKPIGSNVYLISLSKNIDNVGLWFQYADKGSGCNIEFDTGFFDIRKERKDDEIDIIYEEINEEVNQGFNEMFGEGLNPNESNYPLYEVKYIMPDAECDEPYINLAMIEICDHLHKLDMILEKEMGDVNQVDVIREFVINILNEVRFLFKSKHFEAEKEARVVKFADKPKIDKSNGMFPKLYIDLEKDIDIKEIKWGPNIQPTNEIETWLSDTGQVAYVSKTNAPLK